MQKDCGIYALFGRSTIYKCIQNVMGNKNGWHVYVETFIRPYPGCRVLDIGCGPASILEYLGEVVYHGFDINPEYITAAKVKYGSRGTFSCESVNARSLNTYGPFDIILATGVLHHLEDSEVETVAVAARQALAPAGRFVSLDCCRRDGQNPVAKFFIERDRGKNVRTAAEYARFFEAGFTVNGTLTNLLRVPYDHWIMECAPR